MDRFEDSKRRNQDVSQGKDPIGSWVFVDRWSRLSTSSLVFSMLSGITIMAVTHRTTWPKGTFSCKDSIRPFCHTVIIRTHCRSNFWNTEGTEQVVDTTTIKDSVKGIKRLPWKKSESPRVRIIWKLTDFCLLRKAPLVFLRIIIDTSQVSTVSSSESIRQKASPC